MRISVVLPNELGEELERCKRQEKLSTSTVVRQALSSYLTDQRRRTAGKALRRAARKHRISPEQAREALAMLERDREHSDRF